MKYLFLLLFLVGCNSKVHVRSNVEEVYFNWSSKSHIKYRIECKDKRSFQIPEDGIKKSELLNTAYRLCDGVIK